MKQFLLMLMLLTSFCGAAQAQTYGDAQTDPTKQGVIVTPPTGTERHYYLDLLNDDPYDGGLGLMDENHIDMTLVYAADNEVYMLCPFGRRTMPAWLKGELSADGSKLTFKNGQTVFHAVNEDVNYIFVSADSQGNGGADATGSTLYGSDIVLNIDAATGVMTPETDLQCPDVAIVSENAVGQMYQHGRILRLTPVENIDKALTFYTMSYRDADTHNVGKASVKVSVEDDGNSVYIKGLVPAYPQAWVKAEKQFDGKYWAGVQVLGYDFSDYPYFLMCLDGESILRTFPLEYNEADGTYTFKSDTQSMACGYVQEGETSITTLHSYTDIELTVAQASAARPVAPKVYTGIDGDMSCYDNSSSKYTEFIFTADRVDTDGNALNEDELSFRIYSDGQLYTFKLSEYPKLKAGKDLTDIPYSYNDYDYFYKSNTKRYIYFEKVSEPKETIGVELVYTHDGKEYVSDRLVYDIATGKDSVLGISHAMGDGSQVKSVEYYDLSGRRLPSSAKGVGIRLTRYADGSVKTVKVVR